MNPRKLRPNKLTRTRALRLSAIEGLHLSDAMKFKFAEFDSQNLDNATRRKAIIAHYKG